MLTQKHSIRFQKIVILSKHRCENFKSCNDKFYANVITLYRYTVVPTAVTVVELKLMPGSIAMCEL